MMYCSASDHDRSSNGRRIAPADGLSTRHGRRPLTAPSNPSKLGRTFRLGIRIVPDGSDGHVDSLHGAADRHATRHGRRPVAIPRQSGAHGRALDLRVAVVPNGAGRDVEGERRPYRRHHAGDGDEPEDDGVFHNVVPFHRISRNGSPSVSRCAAFPDEDALPVGRFGCSKPRAPRRSVQPARCLIESLACILGNTIGKPFVRPNRASRGLTGVRNSCSPFIHETFTTTPICLRFDPRYTRIACLHLVRRQR